MTTLNQIYKCPICGNIVEVLHTGAGQLVCCGEPMQLIEEKSSDPEISIEKHLPVIEKVDDSTVIKIGSIPHPMEEKHYIEWIEILTKDGKVGRKYLSPGDLPEADFFTKSEIKEARAYCNLHGLWGKIAD